ncbi:sacsin N-terminal ATP-binding-like domain-containing protein, partial [Phytoactinopolyspora endophytica]|uniref:sacsin N-terminal ATP-binding-like domain-containing protein n=1 Tax=Phytoactinopolyspora endophytica TaxID=1642495 RepID=UPI001F0E5B61
MDTLGTAAIRQRVLAAWTASASRFREDANAEEELALGAYRDRLVVELAQNAADAAARGGVDGRLLLRLEGSTLLAANTGAPLDAQGVEGLSTLRASTKRTLESGEDEPVGRFGVGFASVLAVADEPAVYSHDGGVRWSRSETRRVVSGIPELTAELARRGTAVPVLRLPFPADAGTTDSVTTDPASRPGPGTAIPNGYDTAVILPLRDDQAIATTRELLAAVDDALLLVLPSLSEIIIDSDGERTTFTTTSPVPIDPPAGIFERTVGPRRWRLAQLTGRAEPDLLVDRPVDERLRPEWSLAVAVPVHDGHSPDPFGTT